MNSTPIYQFVSLVMLFSVVISGCNEQDSLSLKESKVAVLSSEPDKGKVSMPLAGHITPAEWQSVTQKKILFAHQSVGSNILSGVQSLAAQFHVELHVTESRNATASSGITHFKIGRNEAPLSKIKDFADAFKDGTGQGVDVAMMKLCYIDFTSDTDAKKLAEEYVSSMDRLSNQFPQTSFVAITTPLTTVQRGPKVWLKLLLGRAPGGYVENYRRQEFNNILRDRYGRQGRLFDLAKIEAGGSSHYQYKGQAVESLNPAITSDGGHLNRLGEHVVAAQLLKYIATLPPRP